MIGAWIDHDQRPRAASARAGHHLLAGGGRGPIVGAPDQDQGRDARAPGQVAGALAVRIERHRRAEIRRLVARGAGVAAHRPQRGGRAMRPAEQRDPVGHHPGLRLQPMPGGNGVIDADARGPHAALAQAALRGQSARAETVGKQHGETGGLEVLAPVLVALIDRRFAVAQAVAGMQRHDRRKRAGALGAVQHRPQFHIARGDFDRLGRRGGAQRQNQSGGNRNGQVPHALKAPGLTGKLARAQDINRA